MVDLVLQQFAKLTTSPQAPLTTVQRFISDLH